MSLEDPDIRAARLTVVAAQLAARMRDEPADANARWLRAVLPDADDRFALLFVLAAAVPIDQPYAALVGWFTGDPCTDAFAAHRRAILTGTHLRVHRG
jgi:hypothetical protein